MADTVVDITKDQMDLNQGGSLFIQSLVWSGSEDPTVVILPVQAIQAIGVLSEGPVTYEVTNSPHNVIEGGTALWASWDGVSPLNLCVTAVRFIFGASAGRSYLTVRTFKN